MVWTWIRRATYRWPSSLHAIFVPDIPIPPTPTPFSTHRYRIKPVILYRFHRIVVVCSTRCIPLIQKYLFLWLYARTYRLYAREIPTFSSPWNAPTIEPFKEYILSYLDHRFLLPPMLLIAGETRTDRYSTTIPPHLHSQP
jgi:hypothetical protein